MEEALNEERPPYDVLCEAIEDYISSTYQRATPEGVPPMIAALAEIRTAVESGIDNLLDTGQLTSKGFSTIWMIGTAHEWLDVLRDWEEIHFLPQLELEQEREEIPEIPGGNLITARLAKPTAVKKARKKQTGKKTSQSVKK